MGPPLTSPPPDVLKRLNPFRGLSNPREVWAWGMYDLANQSFTLLIITLLFSLYFTRVIAPDPDTGERWWAITQSSSLLLVVLISPFAGALADARGWRKQFLVGTGVLCVGFTGALAGLGPGAMLLAALIYIPANLCFQVGENVLASFLPAISTPRTIGRVSAIGWTMGYVGALLLLILTAIMMKAFGIGDTERWRPLFIFAAAWFAVGMIPSILFLRDDRADPGAHTGGVLTEGVRRFASTVRHASHYRQLAVFLSAFFVYAFGVQTVVAFASIIASDFGFEQVQLVLFMLQITITAGIASFATALFQDRIGAKATILIYLGVWIVSTLALLGVALIPDAPSWSLWIIGNGIGFGLGGIGTSSRAMVGRCTPRHRAAEFFGLWGMAYKLAGAIGVLSFGAVKSTLGDSVALALLAAFFVVGAVIVLFVSERGGVYAARLAEREHRLSDAPGQRLGAPLDAADPPRPGRS